MTAPEVTRFFDDVQRHIGREQLFEILALRDTPKEKPDGSFVTQGDLLVERSVIHLARKHFAMVHIVSEESESNSLQATEGVWMVVVDPIDGTENFTSGLPEWGISIACYRNGVHEGSLLGAPELGRWLRTGDKVARYRSRIRGLSSSLSREQIMEVGVGPEYRMLGCCVVNMMHVISGSYLSFENPKGAQSWDILAGLNLALEHGLNVEVEGEKYTGEYLTPDRRFRFKVMHSDIRRTGE